MSLRLGWCLDGHHENCREKVKSKGRAYECDCPCHKK